MASFGVFKLTNVGKTVELKAQTGKPLNFTKFVLGDGTFTGNIENLTNLVNPIREEEITRLNVTTVSTTKHAQIGFNLNTATITTGFYLREIGLFAEDPDTHEEVLMYYGNAGDTADYIAPNSSTTISEKLIDILLYISNVETITAVIDTSLVYATQSDITNLQSQITTLGETVTEHTTDISGKADKKKTFNITIPTTGWSASAPYTQTISVTDMLATYIPILDVIYSNTISTAISERDEFAKINKVESAEGSVTLTCFEEVPTIELNGRIEVMF